MNFKRIISLLICIFLLTQAAFAASVGGVEFISAPDSWTLNNATVENGVMTLGFDSTASAERAKSEITTDVHDFSGGILRIAFDSIIEAEVNGDKIKKTITLEDGNMWNSTELINIKNGVVSFFGTDTTFDYTSGNLTFAVDTTANPVMASALADGELVYSGEFVGWKTALDLTAVSVALKNNTTTKAAASSQWTISNFEAEIFKGEYDLAISPQDGMTMISPEDYDGIKIDFGVIMSDKMYSKSNYTLIENGAVADFEIENNNSYIVIYPEGGLKEIATYELTIAKVTDIFGNEKESDVQISFTTAYEGYAPPVVTTTFDFESDYYAGQEFEIEYETNVECSKFEIYVNGELYRTFDEAPYVLSVKETSPKTMKVQAVATDRVGGVGYSEENTLNIISNDAPVIVVTGIVNGSVYDVANLPEISVSAEDVNGIASVEYYADGVLEATFEDASATLSLDGLSGGEHTLRFVATDIYGAKSELVYTITIESVQMVLSYENKFETYNGANTLPASCLGGPQRGYLDVVTIDEEHGKSLAIGIDTINESFNTDNTAYVGFPGGGAAGGVNIEFDIYINERPADIEKNRYRMSFRTANNETSFFFITANEMQFCQTNNTADLKVPYEIKTWYHVSINVNATALTFNMTISDGADFNYTYAGQLNKNSGVLNHFRVFGPAFDDVPTFAAVDNMIIRKKLELPEFVFEEKVPQGKTNFSFSLTQPLMATDVIADAFTLSDEYGKIGIEAVSYDGTNVTVTTASPLRSNMKYKITIDENVRYTAGVPLGVKCEGEFVTDCGNLDVTDAWFMGDSFNLYVTNTTGDEKEIAVVLQSWKNGKITASEVVNVTVDNVMESQYTLAIPEVLSGGYVTAYIWDGIVSPKAVTHRIYSSK